MPAMDLGPKQRLDGRTALVLGASRGIGRAVAESLAQAGARVVLVARGAGELQAAARAIVAAGGSAHPLAMDVCAADAPARLSQVWRQLGRPCDIAVWNVAHYALYQVLEQIEPRTIENLLRTNVLAPLRLLQALLGPMRAGGFGRIVFVGSAASEPGSHGQVVYCASKSALTGLARSVAAEYGPAGVTCNVVLPGLVTTPRVEHAVQPAVRARILERSALGREGRAGEVASVICFLCSDAGGLITGAEWTASGGLGLDPARSGAPKE